MFSKIKRLNAKSYTYIKERHNCYSRKFFLSVVILNFLLLFFCKSSLNHSLLLQNHLPLFGFSKLLSLCVSSTKNAVLIIKYSFFYFLNFVAFSIFFRFFFLALKIKYCAKHWLSLKGVVYERVETHVSN